MNHGCASLRAAHPDMGHAQTGCCLSGFRTPLRNHRKAYSMSQGRRFVQKTHSKQLACAQMFGAAWSQNYHREKKPTMLASLMDTHIWWLPASARQEGERLKRETMLLPAPHSRESCSSSSCPEARQLKTPQYDCHLSSCSPITGAQSQ